MDIFHRGESGDTLFISIQHGGPELFTFDNHNPKGGCVLFNDGTIKFIRTE